VTPTTGTPQDRPQQQQNAANDNSAPVSAKTGSPSQTTEQHVDKLA
jgi:hypothetical protein